MVDRAHVVEAVQFGPETVEGTGVATTKTIRSMSVETKIAGEAQYFRPDGRKFNSLSTLDTEWTAFNLNGKGSYVEMTYPLVMMFGNVTPSSVGTGGKIRVFDIPDVSLLTPKSMTIEKGSSARAQKFAGAILDTFAMTFSRKNGVALTGSGMGLLYQDGITMTGSNADLAQVPIVGKHMDIYVDSTAAGLGTTKLLRAFSVEPSIGGVYGPIWPLDSAQTSYAAHVDLAPSTAVKLALESDAAGMAYLTQFRANTTVFVRVKATGGLYEAGHNYSFMWDMAIQFKNPSTDTENDGVTVTEWDAEFVKDPTWGKAMVITLENDLASI